MGRFDRFIKSLLGRVLAVSVQQRGVGVAVEVVQFLGGIGGQPDSFFAINAVMGNEDARIDATGFPVQGIRVRFGEVAG
jgi:hypothetical protein